MKYLHGRYPFSNQINNKRVQPALIPIEGSKFNWIAARMDITSSDLIIQCSGNKQSDKLVNKSTNHTPQEGRHRFYVETLIREKNHELGINSSRTITRYTHKLLYLSQYLDLRTVVLLAKNPLTRNPRASFSLIYLLAPCKHKMKNLLLRKAEAAAIY